MKLHELAAEILQESAKEMPGIAEASLPIVTVAVDANGAAWRVREPCPAKKERVILAMFRDDMLVDAYCAPLVEKDEAGRPVTFAHYTFECKFIGEEMSLDDFKAAVVEEMVASYINNVGDGGEGGEGGDDAAPQPTQPQAAS